MDEIVRQAMAKWPNVPHCYGWLALDARGQWRMRDDRAQHLGLPGDKLTQPALLGFINRNYASDAQGRWYFQNGPQRVYVNLEATPYIARTNGAGGFVLHTGAAAGLPLKAWMTEAGRIVLDCDSRIAQVEDRDMAECLRALRIDGKAATDEQVMQWLENGPGDLTLCCEGNDLRLERLDSASMPARFGYVALPAAT